MLQPPQFTPKEQLDLSISEKAPTELNFLNFLISLFNVSFVSSSCSINFGFKFPAGLRDPNPKGFRFKLKERVLKVTCCYKCKWRNPIKEKQQNKTNLGLQTSIIRRFFIVSIFLFHFISTVLSYCASSMPVFLCSPWLY